MIIELSSDDNDNESIDRQRTKNAGPSHKNIISCITQTNTPKHDHHTIVNSIRITRGAHTTRQSLICVGFG